MDGDTAIVGPVLLKTPEGATPYMFEMKRESDGKWRTVYGEWAAVADKEFNRSTQTARALRETILSDPTRPGYHFVIPEGLGMPFDPNGAIYWKGRYHLFYIYPGQKIRPSRSPLGPRVISRSLSLAPPSHGTGQRHVQWKLLYQQGWRSHHLLSPGRTRAMPWPWPWTMI